MEPLPSSSKGRMTSAGFAVLIICWATIVADGYDVVVYGAVLPSLLQEPGWGLTPATAGLLGSVPLVGMFVGSLLAGTLADVVGRRRMLIGCLTWFSVLTACCAFAPSPEVFALLRFVAGLGLGGVLPIASAITAEFTPRRFRNMVYAVMFSGFPIGGITAALLGLVIIPTAGWRWMFAVGLVPLLLILPFALRGLPESVTVLRRRGRHDEADALVARFALDEAPAPSAAEVAAAPAVGRTGGLFARRYLFATLCFLGASFLCLFMIYGVNTWLPQIMRQAGYSLGGALTFLLVFNVGACVGTVLVALVADRVGSKPVLIATFVLGAASVALLSARPAEVVMYVAIGLAGIGTIGTQSFLMALVTQHYPQGLAPLGLGWTLGVGRLGSVAAPVVLGLILGSGLGLRASFLALTAAGVLGAVFVVLVPAGGARRVVAPADREQTAVTG